MQIPKRKAEEDRLAMQGDEPIYLTEDGVRRLKHKLERAKLSLPALKLELQEAQAMGDLSENAAYSIAKGRLRGTQGTIMRIEEQLKRVIVIGGDGGDCVAMGTRVSLRCNQEVKEWWIVGPMEADPAKGRISHVSPVGAELMGKKKGEEVRVGNMICIIENIWFA